MHPPRQQWRLSLLQRFLFVLAFRQEDLKIRYTESNTRESSIISEGA